jgi:peptidoglycan/xylan/chitin deacetylase (PgdA/CDA1 family)
MIPAKTPKLISRAFKGFVWDIPNPNNEIFLTFDDGPIPDITPWILDLLKALKIKATFFCVGENITKHKSIFERLINEGHSVGNHTYNHLNGWHIDLSAYSENILKTQSLLDSYGIKFKLFSPPYGKLKPNQSKFLSEHQYKVIMWDVLSKDYLKTINSTQVKQNILSNVSSGSIIVCHDNIKSIKNLKLILKDTIIELLDRGYVLKAL